MSCPSVDVYFPAVSDARIRFMATIHRLKSSGEVFQRGMRRGESYRIGGGGDDDEEDVDLDEGAAHLSEVEEDEEDDLIDEEEERRLMRQRQRVGRRENVFSEPVTLDESWEPPVIEKSPEEREEIDSAIRSNILFASLEEDQRDLIVGAMERKAFSAGDVIIRQGDMGDFYYIVTAGRCEIDVNGKKVLDVSPGMGFGELALLYDSPRAATVKALTDTRTWAIDRKTFKQVVVGSTLRKRQMYEDFLSQVPLLRGLSKGEVLTIADALQPYTFEEGEDVVEEGSEGADRFYLVVSGELKATKSGLEGEVCPRLGPGDYFGELALLEDSPRAATVTAVTRSKCVAMDRAAFLRLLGPVEDIMRRNREFYSRYEEEVASPGES